MDARGHADSGVWEPGTERAHQIKQRSGSPKIPDRLTRIEPDLAVVGNVKDSSAGGAGTYRSEDQDRGTGAILGARPLNRHELRRTQSGEVRQVLSVASRHPRGTPGDAQATLGLVVTISSTAGLEGGEFTSAYAASKFGVEGWMESLAPEIAPFGIRTMLEPGFFRTELLTPESTKYAASSIEDYAERTEQTVTAWKGMNGQQGGDPELADALVYLAGQPERRCVRCWRRGAAFERRANNLLAQANAYRDLSSSLALDSD